MSATMANTNTARPLTRDLPQPARLRTEPDGANVPLFAAALNAAVPFGVDLQAGEGALRDRLLVTMTYLFPDAGPAPEALAAGRALAGEVAAEVRAGQVGTPEGEAVRLAAAAVAAADRKVGAAKAELLVLLAGYDRAVKAGDYPAGARAAIAESEDKLRVTAGKWLGDTRDRLHDAQTAADRVAGRAWRAAAVVKLAQLQDRRQQLIVEAAAFAERAARELLTIDGAERLLREQRPPETVRPG